MSLISSTHATCKKKKKRNKNNNKKPKTYPSKLYVRIWTSSLITFQLPWCKVSHWAQSSPFLAIQLAHGIDALSPPSSLWDFRALLHSPNFIWTLGIWTFSGPASCVASTLPAVPSAQSRYSFLYVKVPHLPDSACHSHPLCKGLLSLLLVPMPDALLWFFVADYCCDFCGFACLVYYVLY